MSETEKPNHSLNFTQKLERLQFEPVSLTVRDIGFVRKSLERNFVMDLSDEEARKSLFTGTNFGTLIMDGEVRVYDRQSERAGSWWLLEDGLSEYYYRRDSAREGKIEDVTRGVMAAIRGEFNRTMLACYEIATDPEEGRCLQLLLVDILRLAMLDIEYPGNPKRIERKLEVIGRRINGCIERNNEAYEQDTMFVENDGQEMIDDSVRLSVSPETLLEFWKYLTT